VVTSLPRSDCQSKLGHDETIIIAGPVEP
jgi:hypothetical protein